MVVNNGIGDSYVGGATWSVDRTSRDTPYTSPYLSTWLHIMQVLSFTTNTNMNNRHTSESPPFSGTNNNGALTSDAGANVAGADVLNAVVGAAFSTAVVAGAAAHSFTLKRKLEILYEIDMKVHLRNDIASREGISKRTVRRWRAAMEQMRCIVEKEKGHSNETKRISRIDGLERIRDGITNILNGNVKPTGKSTFSSRTEIPS